MISFEVRKAHDKYVDVTIRCGDTTLTLGFLDKDAKIELESDLLDAFQDLHSVKLKDQTDE